MCAPSSVVGRWPQEPPGPGARQWRVGRPL